MNAPTMVSISHAHAWHLRWNQRPLLTVCRVFFHRYPIGNSVVSTRCIRERKETSADEQHGGNNDQGPLSKGENSTAKGKKVKSQVLSASFPERLMEIMEHSDYENAIKWSKDGGSFGINPETFTNKVIAAHFRGTQFESMQKRLSRWGFQRTQLHDEFSQNWIVYLHVLFQQGKPDLLRNVSSGEMFDIMTKDKAISPTVAATKNTPPLLQYSLRAEQLNPMLGDAFHQTLYMPTLPALAPYSSLQNTRTLNFLQSPNFSPFNNVVRTRANSVSSQESALLASQLNLYPGPVHPYPLIEYLQQTANTRAASSELVMALSRAQAPTPPLTEQERLFSLLSANCPLDTRRIASLTDEQLVALYLQSHQL